MPGMTTLEENIARLEAATEAARRATSDAHAAVKDLVRERRETERLLGQRAAELVEDRVSELVRSELDRIGPMLTRNSRAIYDRVGSQVDKLIDLAMGAEFATTHSREDLRPQLAAKLRVWIMEILEAEAGIH